MDPSTLTPQSQDPSPFILSRVDSVCDQFETAWKAGRRPRIEEYLVGAHGPVRSRLLRELLSVEVEYRRRDEERPTLVEYLGRFPDDSSVIKSRLAASGRPGPKSTKVSPPRESKPEDQVVRDESERTPTGSEWTTAGLADFRVVEAAPGTILGDYELLERIGQGGMGVVYRARQRGAGRIVALKLIKAEFFGEATAASIREAVDRFLGEAKAAASLEHEHIVPVYEVGRAGDRHFYSMRYVRGISMARMIRTESVADRRAAELLEPIARAVQHAHSRGILHRDLKPSNILIDEGGRPLVTDFGLAKWLEDTQEITRSAERMGTPSFMAPEQARNDGRVGVTADVYGLGATLYALLTGRPPFHAPDPVETLRQVIDEEPVPPRRLRPDVARDLEVICLKCVEKDPRRRYASAEALADDLRRFLANEPIAARPISPAGRAWRWCRRNPSEAGLAAAVALLLVVVSLGAVFAADRERSARLVAVTEKNKAQDQIASLNSANRLLASGRRWIDGARWAKAEQDLSLAVDFRPDNSLLWDERGHLYLRLGLWRRAAPDLIRSFELQGDVEEPFLWFRHAFMRLLHGDREGYRAACSHMLARFANEASPQDCEWIVRACTLAPGATADAEASARLAERGAAAAPGRPWVSYLEGLAQYRAGNYEAAIRQLKEADAGAAGWRGVVQVWPALALAYHRMGQAEEARKWLDRTDHWLEDEARNDSEEAALLPFWWEWASLQVLRREAATAIRGPAAADHSSLLIASGRANAILGFWTEAIGDLTRAINLNPADSRPWAERGQVHVQLRRWARAEADFARALELNPEKPRLWTLRGQVLTEQRRWDEAVSAFGKALNLLPKDASPWSETGFIYNDLTKREELFERMSSARPRDALLWIARGRFHARFARWKEAAYAYAQATAERPPDDDATEHASLLILNGDLRGYRRYCRGLVAKHGGGGNADVAYFVARASILTPGAVADPGSVVRLARKGVEKYPGTPWHLHVLAAAHLRAGRFEMAIARARESMANPSWKGTYVNWPLLALAYRGLRNEGQARQWAEKTEDLRRRATEHLQLENPEFFGGSHPADWLEFQVLAREVEMMTSGADRDRR